MKKKVSSYFYLPNEILDYNLTGAELAVAVRLYSMQMAAPNGGSAKVKQETLAILCGISVSSVKRAISSLKKHEIIVSVKRTVRKDCKLGTYTYCLKPFANSYGYFRIFRTALRQLPANLLRVYLYAAKRKTTGIGGFFKSYSELAQELGMKRSDVIKQMTALGDLGLLRRIRKRTSSGDYTDNTYIVVVFVPGKIRTKAPSIPLGEAPMCVKHKTKYFVKSIIQRLWAFVKGFPKYFFDTG